MMKKLLKEVAVLAMAAVVAVSSVSGVQAAVASPTVSVVPVDKKNVTTTEGNNVDTKADGTAEINDVTVNKNIATVYDFMRGKINVIVDMGLVGMRTDEELILSLCPEFAFLFPNSSLFLYTSFPKPTHNNIFYRNQFIKHITHNTT